MRTLRAQRHSACDGEPRRPPLVPLAASANMHTATNPAASFGGYRSSSFGSTEEPSGYPMSAEVQRRLQRLIAALLIQKGYVPATGKGDLLSYSARVRATSRIPTRRTSPRGGCRTTRTRTSSKRIARYRRFRRNLRQQGVAWGDAQRISNRIESTTPSSSGWCRDFICLPLSWTHGRRCIGGIIATHCLWAAACGCDRKRLPKKSLFVSLETVVRPKPQTPNPKPQTPNPCYLPSLWFVIRDNGRRISWNQALDSHCVLLDCRHLDPIRVQLYSESPGMVLREVQ